MNSLYSLLLCIWRELLLCGKSVMLPKTRWGGSEDNSSVVYVIWGLRTWIPWASFDCIRARNIMSASWIVMEAARRRLSSQSRIVHSGLQNSDAWHVHVSQRINHVDGLTYLPHPDLFQEECSWTSKLSYSTLKYRIRRYIFGSNWYYTSMDVKWKSEGQDNE